MLKIAASGCASRLAIASMCSRMRGSSNSRWVFHGVWFDQPVLSISWPGAISVTSPSISTTRSPPRSRITSSTS